tara:strand:- start:6558 stop:8888 length:2331 start_codon:yes stop_codon:yes gene_type:complete
MKLNRNKLTVLAAALSVCSPALVSAQSGLLEEVVVTAQKREQSIQDVGISITAYSGEQLHELGITESVQLGQQVPGLIVTDTGTSGTTLYNIRGSSQLDFSDVQEPPVAVYTDGAYNSFLSGVGFSFFDLERVEVLRGPQGTLFGRNATGGVVHVISKRPTRELEGYGEVTVGDYSQFRTEGAVSGPLSDTLSGRLSMSYHENDGYVDNKYVDSKLNQINNYTGRGQLLFEPNDDLSLLIIGTAGFDDTDGPAGDTNPAIPGGPEGLSQPNPSLADFQAFCDASTGTLGFPTPPAGSADCFSTPSDGDPYTVLNAQPGHFKRDHYGITANLEWDLDNFHITNILNYQDLKKRFLDGSGNSPIPDFNDFFQDLDGKQFSEEFRVSWETDQTRNMVGVYYLHIDNDMKTGIDDLYGFFDIQNAITLKTESYAPFFQSEWDFVENWTVIGGLRWTEDDKDLTFNPNCPGLGAFAEAATGFPPGTFPPDDCTTGELLELFPPGSAQVVDIKESRSEGDWSGVLELDWTPNQDWLLYAKVSRGHKAGGFNANATATFPLEDIEFDGEILWSYEAGFKSTLFEGTTRFNGSFFYYDYQDFQTFESIGLDVFLSNIDAENHGAEFELITNPWEGWEFLLGLSLQDAEQLDLEFTSPIDGTVTTRNRPMPNAPDVTVNGVVSYEWAAFMGGTMKALVDFNYVDDRSLNAIDHPTLLALGESYTVFNARLAWTSEKESTDIELWVKNLGDEEYFPHGADATAFAGFTIGNVAPPRWYGGTVRYRF